MNIYLSNTTDFNNNGLGFLTDVISCNVNDELNGDYSLEFTYPVSGRLSEYIVGKNIVKCDVGNDNYQLFEIDDVQQDFNIITVTAKHIFYQLNKNFIVDTYPKNLQCAELSNWILSHTIYKNNFTVISSISKLKSARYIRKNPVECLIGTADNSVINLYNAEIERDNFNIKLLSRVGNDNHLKLMFGKNILGINIETVSSDIYTVIMPIGFDGLILPEKFVTSPLVNNYAYKMVRKYEFNDIKYDPDDEEAYHTLDEAYDALRIAAKNLFENGIDKPAINIKVDWLELSKTEEYKEKYGALESVHLGDTIYAEICGLNYKTRVIKTVYNPLSKMIEKFEIGTVKASYQNTINKINESLEKIDNNYSNFLDTAKENATKLITSAMGGYTYKTNNEFFIMDTDNPNTAQKIWRWNLNGLGYSKNGINGPYEQAITQDGQIVADFITVGKINTSLIEGYDSLVNQVKKNLTLKKNISGLNYIVVDDAKLGNVLSFNLYGNVKSDNEYTNLAIEDKAGNKRCIELPFKKLNYLDKNTYDEFVVENNNAKIIRRTEYSTVYNAIEIGDDLSGTSLKLNLYDFQQGNFDLLVTDNYRIRVRSWLNSDGSRSEATILENANQTDSVVLYEYNSSSGEKIKIPYYKLPSDFGIVTEIWDYDIDHTLSNYITKETIGPLVKLDKEKIEDLGECFITLNNGYNKIYLETSNINYKMSYVIKNDYTDVLATQIDLSTTRSQTEKSIIDKVYGKYTDNQGNIHEISSELENKIDKDDDGSLISMINASANVINLNSNRFSMTSDNSKISQDGSVEFLSGLIGGWHIDKNKLWCNIVPEYDYSESDYNRLREILNGSSYSNEEFQKYDIDKSGGLDSKDLLMCRQLIYFNLQKSNPGKLLLDTTDWVKPIKIVNSSGEVIAWFGIRGVGTKDMG